MVRSNTNETSRSLGRKDAAPPRPRGFRRVAVTLLAGLVVAAGLPLAAATPLGAAASAQASDGFTDIRAKWTTYLVGNPIAGNDPALTAAASTRDTVATNYWTTLDKSGGRTTLWADRADWSDAKVDMTISDSYSRLLAMAIAYRAPGSTLEGNTALRDDLLSAMAWLNTNHYNGSHAETGNWYNWEIGSSRALVSLLVLMHDDMTATDRAPQLAALDFWCGDPTHRTQFATTVEEGANRADKGVNVILRGAVDDNATKVLLGRDALDQIYPYVTRGNGFYEDGSFVFHAGVAYTGGYGGPLIQSVGAALLLLKSTPWDITNPAAQNAFKWVEHAFFPLVYRGAMTDLVRGRKTSRENESDHAAATQVAGYAAVFAEIGSADTALRFKQQIKAWMVSDPQTNYLGGQPIYIAQLLKAIQDDSSITPTAEQPSSAVYAGMGRAMQKGDNFAIGLATFSNRIYSFTSGNGENLNGWWQGAGQTAIYAGDSYAFDNHYWATVNMRRLAGTTTDGSGTGTPGAFQAYPNTSNYAGGSTAGGAYGSVGMEFSMQNVTGTDVGGKKSWFMLGDKMVALGADIHGSGTVETVVDNRIVGANADAVKLDGSTVPAGPDGVTAASGYGYVTGADQAHSVGYVFLDHGTVKALNETRTGTWADQGTTGSTTIRTNQFGSFAYQHGTGVTGGSYAYAVLPGQSEAQTSAMVGSSPVTVLRNDSVAQAVSDGSTGVIGANFFTDQPASVPLMDSPYLTVDKKASVTTRETNTEMNIGVADPTFSGTGLINVEINRPAWAVLDIEPGVTVTQLSPTVKLTIDLSKQAPGANFDVMLDTDAPNGMQQPVAQADGHNGHVTLTWDHVGNEVGYSVHYGTSASDLSNTIWVNQVSSTNSINIAGTNGTPLYFSVTAVGAEQESVPSEVVSATPAEIANPKLTVTASDDAWVRDGATYADTNYGSSDHVEVKNDGAVGGGFNRYAYLKFDLSALTDRVDTAKVRLTVTSRGIPSVTNQVASVNPTAAWTERTITYNNRPADASGGVSFPVPDVGQSVDVDVTAQVKAALAAGQSSVTLRVISPFGQGSSAQVNYASIQHATVAARPSLTINNDAALAAPVASVTGVGANSVALAWPYAPEAQSFTIAYGTTSGNLTNTVTVSASAAATQTGGNATTVNGLTTGTQYYFTVTANSGARSSAASAEVTGTPVLAANPTVALQAAADSYVRDGATYADTNFGTVSSMTVKNDAVGFARQSYVKFDLSTITGSINSVKLRLVPSSVGTTGVTHSLAAISDATWTETGLTWNNRPVPGAASATWTVPAAGTAIEVDVTSQVQAAKAAGATSVTFVISQTANQGASSSVSYTTKESGTAANRPQLKVN
ncbi:MAG TPA: polysaccharide lyase family 8 super-sandwich domain-containing protein [Candidatus Lumbricidophila sp.]|nr:polysaccharide lyase family 8 super-sandwich domain-containing protein [Candidatus Lumbricidophila sp.]